jgi:hypothetical protein
MEEEKEERKLIDILISKKNRKYFRNITTGPGKDNEGSILPSFNKK